MAMVLQAVRVSITQTCLLHCLQITTNFINFDFSTTNTLYDFKSSFFSIIKKIAVQKICSILYLITLTQRTVQPAHILGGTSVAMDGNIMFTIINVINIHVDN